jgi:serine-type D-Ala-D-Ala carboxypeptidase/endopeptidase (penicillin-binding protein 4)
MPIHTVRAALSLGSLLCALAIVGQVNASFALLPEVLQQAIRAEGLPPEAVGLWVKRVDDPEPLVQLNARTSFHPASVIKLATTLAALSELGPSHVWTTEIHATAPVQDGVLRGDLVLRGTGDPGMVTEEHWRMLGALRRTGLYRIEGNVYLDTSHFYLPVEDPGAFDGQPLRAYNQPPHALIVNANAVRFHVMPDAGGGGIRIAADPPLPGLQIENRLRGVQGGCGGWQRAFATTWKTAWRTPG